MAAQKTSIASMEEEGDAEGVVVKKSKASCWTRRPLQSNSRSTRCGCPALMWVLRSDDKGWYICEHKAEHNHAVSVNYMEKLH
uniref:FAR1 domain-containing protein n=1 Tax=Triticum urartu TaxID=4572 RepID=A0A8R7U3B7_TRIUA